MELEARIRQQIEFGAAPEAILSDVANYALPALHKLHLLERVVESMADVIAAIIEDTESEAAEE